MSNKINCESCFNYVYDEEYECFICNSNLDEDELGRFLENSFSDCTHYQYNDEYKIVRKQM